MDRKLWTRPILIICILALAIYYVGLGRDTESGKIQIGTNLKGGIDLIGGTSQLWEIDTTGLEDVYGAADEMVRVLRKRVDPDNVRNLVWRTVGNTRIEIQMPLPSEKNNRITQDYLQAVESLEADNISLSAIHGVLRLPQGSQRERRWKELLKEYPDYNERI